MKLKSIKTNLVLGSVCLVLFALLLALLLTTDIASVSATDKPVGLSDLNGNFLSTVGTSSLAYNISEVTGTLLLLSAPCFVLLGLSQLIKGKKLSLIDRDLYCLAAHYALTLGCYVFFEIFIVNYRPITALITEYEASFPSSHTLLSITFGLAAIDQVARRIKSRPLCVIGATILGALIASTVICRALSGVHWLTDIVGSIFLGFALFFFYKSFVCYTTKSPRNSEE